MPELPEVESVVRILKRDLAGTKIVSTGVFKPKIIAGLGNSRLNLPDKTKEFVKFCNNRQIVEVSRRAKNILIKFDRGLLLVHFKMTGQLLYVQEKPDLNVEKHIHILWQLDKGWLYYKDIRQFGYVLTYNDMKQLTTHFSKLGFEPLSKEFEYQTFHDKLTSKKAILKKVFLDQTVVVGLGNIYADEVCHYAKVLPYRICSTLTTQETKRLYKGIRSILVLAIEAGGTTKYTHTLPDGSQGQYVNFLQVYGRTGKPCYRCQYILQSNKTAGRTTVFCLNCQK